MREQLFEYFNKLDREKYGVTDAHIELTAKLVETYLEEFKTILQTNDKNVLLCYVTAAMSMVVFCQAGYYNMDASVVRARLPELYPLILQHIRLVNNSVSEVMKK